MFGAERFELFVLKRFLGHFDWSVDKPAKKRAWFLMIAGEVALGAVIVYVVFFRH